MFRNEMEGVSLRARDGTLVPGEILADANPLDNGLSVLGNIGVLFGILVFCRLVALVGLKLAWRLNWL
jgi:hypothetical protein